MKKYGIFLAVFCVALVTVASADAKVDRDFELRPTDVSIKAIEGRSFDRSLTKVDIQKLDFRGIAPTRDVLLDEADFEPNDWDGANPPWLGWQGFVGVLSAVEPTILSGAIDSTGVSGWYTGDNDMFGFSLPGEGVLDLEVAFNPDCSGDNLYNVWFLGAADDGELYILDVNFPYPSIGPVICPHVGSYAFDPYGEVTTGVYFINEFYLCIGGAAGDPTAYTITWDFSECSDLDTDGYYDETCGGTDCDDGDPFVHPCALEIPSSGVDEDCSGTDRVLSGGEISEAEPNDTSEAAQDLGALAIGNCYEIEGNYCSAFDADYFLFDLPVTGIALTLEIYYEGITEEIDCFAFEGQADFWIGIVPGDLDEDGFYDVGDYRLTICAAAAADADGDGWYDEADCGFDCDDTDPFINPCDPEVYADCGDGIDNDCTGIETTLGEDYFPVPDGDLDCGGTPEAEPNDTLLTANDLGTLDEAVTTAYGSLSSVGINPFTGAYVGDHDYFTFEMPNAGFVFAQVMFDCLSDYDVEWYAYFDPDGAGPEVADWFLLSYAWYYVPETLGGVLVEDGGWEFPVQMALLVVGYDGTPGFYSIELYFDSACVDADGDGYGGTPDPDFETLHGYAALCEEDCDDTDAAVNPGADEICANGVDDDCDGDVDEPDCVPAAEFILELDVAYAAGTLSLDFTLQTPETATWANFLILTHPSVQVVPLWSVPLPVIPAPWSLPVSFPLPSMGTIGIYSGLFTGAGPQAFVLEWVDTGK